MKTQSKNYWKILLIFLLILTGFLSILDFVVLPIYVSGTEVRVPNVIGRYKEDAIKILEEANLNPIIQTSRYDERYAKDHVIFQKPSSGVTVKENRRIYITISGGEPLVRMPFLINKTIRDAKVTLERIGLYLGQIDSIESEFPTYTVVEQQYLEGREIAKGTSIDVKVSIGPQIGMIRVPKILGLSLSAAENILKKNSLKIGIKTYIFSSAILPNTIVEQQPSENTLLKIGDSVNVVLTQSGIGAK